METKLYKVLLALVMLFALCNTGYIEPDPQHPLAFRHPHSHLTGQAVTVGFRLPKGSPGVNFRQFIAIQLPTELATELSLDTASNFGCTLHEGSTMIGVTAVPPVQSPIVNSLSAERTTAYCQLTDRVNNVLKAQTYYRLTVTLTQKVTSTNWFRSVALFTTTANNPEGIIIDHIPVIGTLGQYGDYSAFTPKSLDISNVSITVTSGPSSANSGTVIYPYNSFDLTISLKANDFLFKDDIIVVFTYPTNTVSPATSVSTALNAANDPLQVALAGTLSISSFSTNGLLVSGINEDLRPNRQFQILLRGWRALDTNIGNASPLQLWVYYKNTYSVVSFASNNAFTVSRTALTSTGIDHVESWDIFQNAAWPFKFDFKTNSDLTNGAYVVIQHTNANDNNSRWHFIASTCDFSGNDATIDQSFGKRPTCFPLRNDVGFTGTAAYNGSGIFFWLSTVSSTKTYTFNVWGFADKCGAGRDPFSTTVIASTQFQFTITAYKSIDTTKVGDARFTSQTILGQSSAITQGGKCWGSTIQGAAAFKIEDELIKSKTKETTAGDGNIVLAEPQDVYITSQTARTCTTCHLDGINANAPTRAYINSTSNSITTNQSYLQFGAYFYAAADDDKVWSYIPIAYGKHDAGAGDPTTALPGYFQLQLPRNWFVAGDGTAAAGPTTASFLSWAATFDWATTGNNNQLNLKAPTAGTIGADNNFFGSYNTGTNSADFTLNNGATQLPPSVSATTGTASIYRIRSKREPSTGGNTTLFNFIKNGAGAIKKGTNANPYVLLSFFTTYVKWSTTLPTIKSLYTAIDIQVQWLTARDDASTPVFERVIRFLNLYPQYGFFQDPTNKTSTTATPVYFHYTHGTSHTNTAVCVTELNGAFLTSSSDGSTNTLVVFLFGHMFLETDYADNTAVYPAAPLVSSINPYASPSALPFSTANNYGTQVATTGYNFWLGTISEKTAKEHVPYLFYLSPTILFTGVSGSTVTTTATTNQPNLLIPYYCPPSTAAASYYRPVVVANWIGMTSHAAFTGVTKFLGNNATTNRYVHVATAKTVINASGTQQNATLRWPQYTNTATPPDNILYIYNATKNANGVDVNCSAFTWFVASSVTVDTSTTMSASVATTVTPYLHNYGKNFHVFGKTFNKAILAANSTTSGKITAAGTTTLAATSSFSITNIKRPTVDKFTSSTNLIIHDLVGFFCTSLTAADANWLSNYLNTTSGGSTLTHFLVDYNPDLTTAWTGINLSADKTEGVYKNDPAGSLKIQFTTPATLPVNAQLTLTANNNSFTSNTICGIQQTGFNVVEECSVTSGTHTCQVRNNVSSFTICCYNIFIVDTVSLNTVNANFPTVSTVSGLSGYQQQTIYRAQTNGFTWTTGQGTANDVITSNNARITNIAYTQVIQESGLGKIKLTITLPREPARNMRLTLNGDISSLVVSGNIPRCVATFSTNNLGDSWDGGDALLDTCSVNSISSSTNPLVITTKNMVYKCGLAFSKTLTVYLWPVFVVNWNSDALKSNTYKLSMTLGTGGDNIANNTNTFSMPSTIQLAAKPTASFQGENLCAVSAITPRIVGELADYTFDFDLDTNKNALNGSNPNELTIFFPHRYFGEINDQLGMKTNFACYNGGVRLNCIFDDNGILNIRFAQNLAVGTGRKYQVILSGIVNPPVDIDINFPCTINNFNANTNRRLNIVTGSGKLSGGIKISANANQMGNLIFLNAGTAVTDANPRNIATVTLRIAFDRAIGSTLLPLTINKNPYIIVTLPQDYHLHYYTATRATVSIDEFSNDSVTNVISRSGSITPTSVTQLGNRIYIYLPNETRTFPTTWRYWDVKISNITGPLDTTISTLTKSTSAFSAVITNSDFSILYRSYTGLNTLSSSTLVTNVDNWLSFNRGLQYQFDNLRWVIDVKSSTFLNSITVRPGRYLQYAFSVKPNTSNTILPAATNMSLTDSLFKLPVGSYLLPTSYYEDVPFHIGVPCGSIPGNYLIYFTTSDTTNFAPLAPVEVLVDNSRPGTISYANPPTLPAAGSLWLFYTLSEPNVDVININWTSADNVTNDPTSSLTNIVLTPFSSAGRSYFRITNNLQTAAQQYKTSDPNSCYSWASSNLSFTIQGTTAVIPPNSNLVPDFTYENASTASTTTTTLFRNSLRFTYTPRWSPVYLYCVLTCFTANFPSDAEIQDPKNTQGPLLKYYSSILSDRSAHAMVFNDLVRGQRYKLRCIITSTEGVETARTSSSVNLETFTPATITNATAIQFIPTPSQLTMCQNFIFNSDPGQTTKNAINNYAQKIFSIDGWSVTGCIIATDLSYYTVPGLSFPTNVTCNRVNATRLRNLQAAATTVNATVSHSVCPVPHRICRTDVGSGNTNNSYQRLFNQIANDLKTNALFQTTLSIANVNLNNITTTTDAAIPNLDQLTVTNVNWNANGLVSWNAYFPTNIMCYYRIDSSSAPAFENIELCTDTSRCGTFRASPFTVSGTTNQNSLTAFTPGTYNMWIACYNDIPYPQQKSVVRSGASFTVPQPTPPPAPVSSSFLNFNFLLIALIFILFN